MPKADASYPLAGLKVLDMSRVLAGPFAGRMLSDLGADVVKVEPPDGDITRLWGKVVAGIPGYFHQQNAGKRNISVDLRAPGARELVLDLVRQADVLIENYRPDVMPRLGLGYEALREVNPRLVMLSISGFGRDGPEFAPAGLRADRPRRGRPDGQGLAPGQDSEPRPAVVGRRHQRLAARAGRPALGVAAARTHRTGPAHRHRHGRCDHRHRRPDPLRTRGVGAHAGPAQRHLGDRRRGNPGVRGFPLPVAAADYQAATSGTGHRGGRPRHQDRAATRGRRRLHALTGDLGRRSRRRCRG